MKEIILSKGFKSQVDDDDYDHLSKYSWHVNTDNSNKYARRTIRHNKHHYEGVLMHRQIMGVSDRKIQIDHIDGNGLNNQKNNLRLCDQFQNQLNKKKLKSKSIFIGLTYYNNKWGIKRWAARIQVYGKSKFIGLFFTEYEAAIARDQYILDNNLLFARLNILKRNG